MGVNFCPSGNGRVDAQGAATFRTNAREKTNAPSAVCEVEAGHDEAFGGRPTLYHSEVSARSSPGPHRVIVIDTTVD